MSIDYHIQQGNKVLELMPRAVGDRVRGQYRLDDRAAVRTWLRGVAALHDSRRE
jgi:hypothetical protein